MTLNQLSYYLAVCKHQNLTKAAAELSVSQPGLSAAIRTRKTGLYSGKGKSRDNRSKNSPEPREKLPKQM